MDSKQNTTQATQRVAAAFGYCRFGSEALKEALASRGPRRAHLAHAVVLLGEEAMLAFEAAVDQIVVALGKVSETVSRKFLEDRVFELFVSHRTQAQISDGSVRDMLDAVRAMPLQEWRILREITGASFDARHGPLRLGGFTFYDYEAHRDAIGFESLTTWPMAPHQVLVECSVSARETDRSTELADVLFARLDYTLRFLLRLRGGRYAIGVHNFVAKGQSFLYRLAGEQSSSQVELVGPAEPISLDGATFTADVPRRIISLVTKQANDLERRIGRCVEWTGQAIVDFSIQSALVKCGTALECLMVVNQKGVITSSILATIAESAAHVLGTSVNSALAIEREVKRLYSLRSATVHAGDDKGSIVDLRRFLAVSHDVVFELLTNPKYECLTSIEQIHERARRDRFSYLKGAGPGDRDDC
jgi:hypothetical protein